MKKQYKWAAVLSAAAVLSMGAAITSMAATSGWSYENDGWVYLDSSGSRVTDQWKKSGDYWYYLDSDGGLLTDQWIDDTYYVNGDGVMQMNQWVYVEEGADGPVSDESGWFYLGTNGKIVTDSWKQINSQYYYFDDDGRMCTGWHYSDDDVYYLGDDNDGTRKTGWLCLTYDEDDEPEEGDVSDTASAGDGAEWFYFQSSGKMVKADSSYTSKTINGSKYYFDEKGIMLTGWASVASASDDDKTGISGFKYFGDENDGTMAKGWKYLSTHPSESDDADAVTSGDTAEPEDGDSYWYYFGTDGIPKYLADDADTLTAATSRVSSNTYFFNEYGCMQTGLIGFDFDGTHYTAYFGSSDDDGKMKTGKQTSVYDGDDEKGTYYFITSGSYKGGGFTGVKDDYLYYNGKLVEADDDTDYQVFCVNDTLYLVNESGRIQTSVKKYKSDSVYAYEYVKENGVGVIYRLDADGVRGSQITADDVETLPVISYDLAYGFSDGTVVSSISAVSGAVDDTVSITNTGIAGSNGGTGSENDTGISDLNDSISSSNDGTGSSDGSTSRADGSTDNYSDSTISANDGTSSSDDSTSSSDDSTSSSDSSTSSSDSSTSSSDDSTGITDGNANSK